jgi:transcriptional regulator with XRE-family HTH domain
MPEKREKRGNSAQDHFGAVLRQRRDDLRRSQRDVAERSHFDRSYIADLELGNANPSLGTILRLADALDLTPAELMRLLSAAIAADPNYEPERKRPPRGIQPRTKQSPETTT